MSLGIGESVKKLDRVLRAVGAGVVYSVLGIVSFLFYAAVGLVLLILAVMFATAAWEAVFPPSPEDLAWAASSSGPDEKQVGRLSAFVTDYPESKRKAAALERIEELAWRIASTPDAKIGRWGYPQCVDVSALTQRSDGKQDYYRFSYSDYVQAYPSGVHAEEARRKLEERCWEDAKRDSPDLDYVIAAGHLRYLEAYPDGTWKTEANSFVSRRFYEVGLKQRSREYLEKALQHMTEEDFRRAPAKAAVEEIASWAKAVEADDYEAFREHLKVWPNGHERAEAVGMMEYHGRWKRLPVSEKVLGVLAKDFKDAIEVEEVTAALYSPEWEARCRADRAFLDLVNGYALAANYHEAVRRRVHFGFYAPFGDRAKAGFVELVKGMGADGVRELALAAWKRAALSGDQRRQLKELADVALEHERIFDAAYDQVAAEILGARWDPRGFDGWYELQGFPRPSNPCYQIGFDVFSTGIRATLFDFWYIRELEGTRSMAKAGLEAIRDAGVKESASPRR